MSTEQLRPALEDPTASAELRQLVELARQDGPSRSELQKLAAQVGAITGVPLVSPPLPSVLGIAPEEVGMGHELALASLGKRAFSKLLSSTAAKWVAAVGLSAGLGLAAWNVQRAQSGVPATLAGPPARDVAAPEAAPVRAADVPIVTPLQIVPVAIDGEELGGEKQLRHRPLGRARGQRTERAASGERLRALSSTKPSELELIQQAEAARADRTRALDLLQEHEHLYPAGVLAQEREALAIELLIGVGERERAESRAARFSKEHPGSAHLPRVRALLERAGAE